MNKELLESMIIEKPAYKLYTSNSIISKDVEKLLGVDTIEKFSKNIRNIRGNDKKGIDEILSFFALQEARNIGVFYIIKSLIQEMVDRKHLIKIDEFKSVVNYGYLLDDENFNKLFIGELHSYIESVSTQKKEVVFELAKKIFNEIYPKIYKEKKNKYLKLRWVILTIMDDDTMGCSNLPVVDFSEYWHQYHNNDIFKKLKLSTQSIIKNSVVMILGKRKILLGLNVEKNMDFVKGIEYDDLILSDFLKDCWSFINIYLLLLSFEFFTITSDKQKEGVFHHIIENFNTLKIIRELNEKNHQKL